MHGSVWELFRILLVVVAVLSGVRIYRIWKGQSEGNIGAWYAVFIFSAMMVAAVFGFAGSGGE